jgi:hypothetical protein
MIKSCIQLSGNLPEDVIQKAKETLHYISTGLLTCPVTPVTLVANP